MNWKMVLWFARGARFAVKRQTARWLTVTMFAVVTMNVRGEIQPGASRDQAVQELGSNYSSTKIGNIEELHFKNGTYVRLTDGVVTELTKRGKTGVVRMKNNSSTNQSPNQNPARSGLDLQDPSNHPPAEVTGVVLKAAEVIATNMALAVTNAAPAAATAGPAGIQPSAKTEPPGKTNLTAKVPSAYNRGTAQIRTHRKPGGLGVLWAQIRQLPSGMLLPLFLVVLLVYAFSCYCYQCICQKAKLSPGAMIWIPVAQFLPLLRVARMADWMLILLLVPFVNLVAMLIMWARICVVLHKNAWLAATLLVPGVNLVLIPYLAFSGTNRADRAEDVKGVEAGPK